MQDTLTSLAVRPKMPPTRVGLSCLGFCRDFWLCVLTLAVVPCAVIILFVMRMWCVFKDMAKSPDSAFSCSIVSRDRVFEQIRSSFEMCGLTVSLEDSC